MQENAEQNECLWNKSTKPSGYGRTRPQKREQLTARIETRMGAQAAISNGRGVLR